MKLLRKITITILGFKNYIKIASKSYIWLVSHGFLKKQYPELFYLQKIIKPGFVCIDIGANLGYYSVLLSKLTGENGKVLSVEPIPMFGELWKKNVKASKLDNLQLFQCALGAFNGNVKMGIPERNGIIHHGMTKIVTTAQENYRHFFDVEMKVPDELFSNLERLDFIKCDVEGYESEVFPNMINTITKFKPLIQTELTGKENKQKVVKLLKGIGYSPMILRDSDVLIDVDENSMDSIDQDFYFICKK